MTRSNPALGAWRCDATGLALLRIGGEDATSFLDAQTTTSLDNAEDKLFLAAIANPQGRVMATFYTWFADDAWLIALPACETAWLQAHLARFVFRAQVTIAPATKLALIGVCGDTGASALATVGLPVPEPGRFLRAGDLAVLGLAGERWLLAGPDMALADAGQALGSLMAAGSFEDWKRARLLANEVEIRTETRARFLPQMLGLVELGAVSFDKGCYPGQEIIARAKRGNVKRGLRLLRDEAASRASATIELDGMRAEVLDRIAAENGGALVQVVAPNSV